MSDRITDERTVVRRMVAKAIMRHQYPSYRGEPTHGQHDIADAVLDALGLVREVQVRWEWPGIPEGWRYCDNQTLTNDGRMFRTATAAPKNETPYDHEHQHVEARRSEVERWVTPWSEAKHSASSQVVKL